MIGRRRILAGALAGLAAGAAAPGRAAGAAGAGGLYPVEDFGAAGDGLADDTAAIQRAIDAARPGGGVVRFIPGRIYRCAGRLSLDGARGVALDGQAPTNQYDTATLLYTGVAAPFLSLRASYGVALRDLRVRYDNPAFRGDLILHGAIAPNVGSNQTVIDGCSLSGTAGVATRARSLVNFDWAICSAVRGSWLSYADCGVLGRGSGDRFCNVLKIVDCIFASLNVAGIRNAGQAWTIDTCTFEPLAGGGGLGYTQDGDIYAQGTTFVGCWFGDAHVGGGYLLNWQGYGLHVVGSFLVGAGEGLGNAAIRVFGSSQGINITGNRISEVAFGVDLSDAPIVGVHIAGNLISANLPLYRHGAARELVVVGNSGGVHPMPVLR